MGRVRHKCYVGQLNPYLTDVENRCIHLLCRLHDGIGFEVDRNFLFNFWYFSK